MYKIPYFLEKDETVIKAFIKEYPFAFISGVNKNGEPVATQIPVFIEEKNGKQVLRGHIMRNTDHHKAFLENNKVLIVFVGKHTYVSATWYSNKNVASTWNYMSVHVKGNIRFLDNEALKEVLQLTSLYFENNNEQSPTTFENLPPSYYQAIMKAIVAFEIEIQNIEAIFKLSQNRDYESYISIIKHLKKQNHDAQVIATEMEKRIGVLFPEKR